MKDTEFFITKSLEVHGNLYDYSKSVYTGRHKKLTIICNKHGDFQIEPSSHYLGAGCPMCYLEKFNFNTCLKPNKTRNYKRNKAKRNKTKDFINRKILLWAKRLKLVKVLGNSCPYCGEKRIWSLCFHHKNPENKKYTLMELYSKKARFEDLVKEAKKCELVCHNCHRSFHPITSENRIKNKKLCLMYLHKRGCDICGYSKYLNALEFHHKKEDKIFRISQVLPTKTWSNPEDIEYYIKKELDKCAVLCRNCHQEVHTDTKFFYDNVKEIISKSEHLTSKNKIDESEVLKQKQKGLNRFEIAKNLKCSPVRIFEILKSYKI